jgi:DNA-binding transcriptional ArsR family regulator
VDKEEKMRKIKSLDFTEEAEMLRVLAHPVRLQIAYGLSEIGDCNVKNIWSCLGLPQSNVSQHLNLMKSRGLIGSRRQGVEVHYFLTNPMVNLLIQCLMKHRSPEVMEKAAG